MNVLVYNGSGVSASSRDHTVSSLKSFLGRRYDVQLVTPRSLKEEPWQDSCALLVFPGGRDLPYVFDLEGEATNRIKRWINEGGKYLGFCAGAYFASSRVEFEVGTPLEVVGDRALSFFPGVCRGTVFPGFDYETESGARQVSVALNRAAFRDAWPQSPSHVHVWYNGGGSFELIDWDGANNAGVEILGRYDSLDNKPVAGVQIIVGLGKAVLWGVHPEHPSMLEVAPDLEPSQIAERHEDKERRRRGLMRATLTMLDLEVSEKARDAPPLSPLLLAAEDSSIVRRVVSSFSTFSAETDEGVLLRDRHDVFRLSTGESFDRVAEAAMNKPGPADAAAQQEAIKDICAFVSTAPLSSHSPLFDIGAYFQNRTAESCRIFGSPLLYGEVVTSTQTMLDKNDKFLSCLPTGSLCLASHQVAGRGRGGNSWISPAGCLQFSMVLRLGVRHASKIVFLQYLFGLAVIEAVRMRGEGCSDIGLVLKWPNDIYASVGSDLRKIGGILVNSSFQNDEFTLVVGCGVNLSNSKPTTSVNEIIARHNADHETHLSLVQPEQLLARICAQLDEMWPTFVERGFEPFVDQYLSRWLHSNQRVTIEATRQLVEIVGITPDHGLLRTAPIDINSFGNERRSSGQFIDLQPDGNSFDMLKGLLSIKR
ncbi:biotin holocarboxylase synthetase [Microbotryomycetes sp. JL221]|nr:biotin holocarboxylase synthetase [Microbotryomycetes sp. JL221]